MKAVKRGFLGLGAAAAMRILFVYIGLTTYLTSLDGNITTSTITEPASLRRDSIGTAVISAPSQSDAAGQRAVALIKNIVFISFVNGHK
jgi:hypothetical protein